MLFLVSMTTACMSDEACGDNYCCYMNTCLASDSVECSPYRLDIFKAINKANIKDKQGVRKVVDEMRNQFDVTACDEALDGCIDYIGIMADQLNISPPSAPISFAARPATATQQSGHALTD